MAFETTAEDPGLSVHESKIARKWRTKLFSKDKDRLAVRDKQVDDFLGSSRPAAAAAAPPHPAPGVPLPAPPSQSQSSQSSAFEPLPPLQLQSSSQPRLQTRPGVTAPRIDVAAVSQQRWPASDENPSLPTGAATALDTGAVNTGYNSTTTKKKPRKQGLKVRFSTMAPTIIGEGGDDSEEPTREISLQRERSNSSASQRTHDSLSDSNSNSNYGDSAEENHQKPFPTALSAGTSNQSSQNADFLMALGDRSKGNRLSWRADADQNVFARNIQAKMRQEEGLALQKALADYDTAGSALRRKNTSHPKKDAVYKAYQGRDSPASSSVTSSNDGLSNWTRVTSALPNGIPNGIDKDAADRKPYSPKPFITSPVDRAMEGVASPPPSYLRSESKQSNYSDKANSEKSYAPYHRKDQSLSSLRKGSPFRSAVNAVNDTALQEFSLYVDNYNKCFNLYAERIKPNAETSLSEWVRASVWWFIRGRAELEVSMRTRPQPGMSDHALQAIVNLAKAWWICKYIVPNHWELEEFGNLTLETMPGIVSTAGDQRLNNLMSIHQSIVSHLRALAISMKRNNIIPEGSSRAQVAQGINTSVWIRYPFFAPAISAVLSGLGAKSMLADQEMREIDLTASMPLGDNSRYFCYGRMFVEATLGSRDDDSEQYAIPCMLSITRDRTDWHVIGNITSQNELVNLAIQDDKKKGPTWKDVEWQVRSHSMALRLPRGFELDVQFQEADFKMLWKIVDYTQRVEADLLPQPGEIPIFADILKAFQYSESGPSKSFPPEPTERCRIQLFEKTIRVTEGTGARNFHRGFRIFAVTSPKVKTLSSVAHTLANGTPIVFGYLRGDDGAPAMILKHSEKGVNCSMLLTFHDTETRAKLHSLLTSLATNQDEIKSPELSLKSFSMESLPSPTGQPPKKYLHFDSSRTLLINNDPSYSETGHAPTVLSENLRIFTSSQWGSVTDRINIGPGGLKIGLNVTNPTALSVLRPPHEDLGIAVAENLISGEIPSQMLDLVQQSQTQFIARRYNFSSLPELHKFEQELTGFRVLFDGSASMFAISRRRMVVPIYKKWEANRVRLQIAQQETVIQLLAFFEGYNHGKSMNFVLKSTDVFECFARSGKYGVRIVDAKFALPKPNDDEAAEFVCLDMPEYPGEHDDISIGFDTENDLRQFQAALPGSVRQPSRGGSLRK